MRRRSKSSAARRVYSLACTLLLRSCPQLAAAAVQHDMMQVRCGVRRERASVAAASERHCSAGGSGGARSSLALLHHSTLQGSLVASDPQTGHPLHGEQEVSDACLPSRNTCKWQETGWQWTVWRLHTCRLTHGRASSTRVAGCATGAGQAFSPRVWDSITGSPSYIARALGVPLPVPGLGTANAAAVDILSALRLGYRHVDTAQRYGNERDVGR